MTLAVPAVRLLAAGVAASAWFGLVVQFGATLGAHGAPLAAAWILARYYTILVDLAVALTFSGLAAGRAASPALCGGLALNALLVAVVYRLLIAGTLVQTGPERLADLFLHGIVPALAVLFWLLAVPHGRLRPRDVGAWAAAPVAYLAYALLRGSLDGIYPYPFLDGPRIGWGATALYALAIAAGFLVAGFGLVALDRALGRRGRPGVIASPAEAPAPSSRGERSESPGPRRSGGSG